MDGFRQTSCVARHLSDTSSRIFQPATFLSSRESRWGHETLRSVATRRAPSSKRLRLARIKNTYSCVKEPRLMQQSRAQTRWTP